MTYTIRCNEHQLSDGRLIGLEFDTMGEAAAAAEIQTDKHRELELDCVFEVIPVDANVLLSEEEFMVGIMGGIPPFQLIRAMSPLSWELDGIEDEVDE